MGDRIEHNRRGPEISGPLRQVTYLIFLNRKECPSPSAPEAFVLPEALSGTVRISYYRQTVHLACLLFRPGPAIDHRIDVAALP